MLTVIEREYDLSGPPDASEDVLHVTYERVDEMTGFRTRFTNSYFAGHRFAKGLFTSSLEKPS